MDVAQALYGTHKATTYPKTDCGHLPTSMLPEMPAVLEAIRRTDFSIAPVVASVDPAQRSRAWNYSKKRLLKMALSAEHGDAPDWLVQMPHNARPVPLVACLAVAGLATVAA